MDIVPTSKAFALELQFPKKQLNHTLYLPRGAQAPFPGYLVEPDRLEKVMIAIKDLESTKNEFKFFQAYTEEKAKNDNLIATQKLEVQKREAEAVEKGLTAKIANLNVWYKKPFVVAIGVSILFIATGVLLP